MRGKILSMNVLYIIPPLDIRDDIEVTVKIYDVVN